MILFPNVHAAVTAQPAFGPAMSETAAILIANFWTNKLGVSVDYCHPGTPFRILENHGEYARIQIHSTQEAWIFNANYMQIREI